MDTDASLNILSDIDEPIGFDGAFDGATIDLSMETSTALTQTAPGNHIQSSTEKKKPFPGKQTYLNNTRESLFLRHGISELAHVNGVHRAKHGSITDMWNNMYDGLVVGYNDANGNL